MLYVPEHDTGIGLHYFDDQDHYGVKDVEKWLPALKAMGVSWLTVVGSLDRAIPESFLRALIEREIEPIIHLPLKPVQKIDQDALATLCRSYARWGAHYVVMFDRPNTRTMWALGEWGTPNLVNQFVDALTPCIETIKAHNLAPVFTPLKQGGDYWDTSFLDHALTLIQKSKLALLDDLIFGVHGFAGNRPADWGAGGPRVWTQTRPYHTPHDSQDQNGFRAFEWYQDVIMAKLGTPRPMLMIGGGAVIGGAADSNFPPLTVESHAAHNAAIADAMLNRSLPDYLLNVSFWSLDAWFVNDKPLPAAQMLQEKLRAARQRLGEKEKTLPKDLRGLNRSASVRGASQELGGLAAKSLYHYVLLPTFEWGASDWHWHAAMEYMRVFQPTCGFSLDEARHAEFVTIVGNEQGISKSTEDELRSAGCKVERVCGKDGEETKKRLSEMAKGKKRFVSAI